jgi:hypothetical protein
MYNWSDGFDAGVCYLLDIPQDEVISVGVNKKNRIVKFYLKNQGEYIHPNNEGEVVRTIEMQDAFRQPTTHLGFTLATTFDFWPSDFDVIIKSKEIIYTNPDVYDTDIMVDIQDVIVIRRMDHQLYSFGGVGETIIYAQGECYWGVQSVIPVKLKINQI